MNESELKPKNGYGFYKAAAATFRVVTGDVHENARSMENIIRNISEDVQLLVFPELSLTGYTCGDLFLRKEFLEEAMWALKDVIYATRQLKTLVCIGMPVEDHGRLFNCAVYIQCGEIKGVVPKTYIPNYGEYYEKRWFVSSTCRQSDTIKINGQTVPFSENLLLNGGDNVIIATEICEDLWTDSPPSGPLSRAGATVIVNPSASNDVIGKREYRRNLVGMQSGRCRAGYVYASCGAGESTTDLVFSGHCIIADNGKIIKETGNGDVFSDETIITGVIDIERCVNDRRKYNSDVWAQTPEVVMRDVFVSAYPVILPETVNPHPFVPESESEMEERCQEVLSIQVRGLMQRLLATGIKDVVIGISGGLDSTLALIVCREAFLNLGIKSKHIHGITMPGFGTSRKTLDISNRLMEVFGIHGEEISIEAACRQHLKDIGHPEDVYDIAYENAQARERTKILFDIANMRNALVIGTGDMSELALGWCTYNGDHMSNYSVNSGIPKTLVAWLIKSYAKRRGLKILEEILELPISPELLPPDENGEISQKTEDSIGKYEYHDFFLYHYLRNGFGRRKILKLAEIAFGTERREEIETALDVFYKRFRTQQFKRSCMPDGPKVGSVSLSPRGDLRMPSDLMKMY